jgi:hypothetical protein
VTVHRLLEDIVAEEKKDAAFAKSQDELSPLAEEAVGGFKQGQNKPLAEML